MVWFSSCLIFSVFSIFRRKWWCPLAFNKNKTLCLLVGGQWLISPSLSVTTLCNQKYTMSPNPSHFSDFSFIPHQLACKRILTLIPSKALSSSIFYVITLVLLIVSLPFILSHFDWFLLHSLIYWCFLGFFLNTILIILYLQLWKNSHIPLASITI